MKVAINTKHGGFGLSDQAFEMLLELKGIKYDKVPAASFYPEAGYDYYVSGMDMHDPDAFLSQYDYTERRADLDLIKVIETLGEDANSWACKIKIVEIPDDVEWEIGEYDGLEWVAEKHRTWS